MKTPLEVLEETVAYYLEDPSRRGVYMTNVGMMCQYLTEDGNMCAVGRCLDQKKSNMKYKGCITADLIHEGVFKFKEEYDLIKQGYNLYDVSKFWGMLQTLHDTSEYWELTDKYAIMQRESYINTIRHFINDTFS